MPYIPKEKRVLLKPTVPVALEPGELNYQLSEVAKVYWLNHSHNYQTINDIKGAFQGALAEFDRQITEPYEDKKIAENGPLWADE